ncbi:MobA/MobL family protein [Oceaniradius stylonematis]|uniref:MobA/MobL family protein n=1 Tax=Oceaniradius stylonematis TaxID=2184161 RepID=UPI003C7CEC6C
MQDGNIHCHIDNLSRKSPKHGERFALATAAYNAGQRLWSAAAQRHVDFGNREDVVVSAIVLPEGAPEWAADRTQLWNTVDTTARRKDARLAKTIEAAITREVPTAQREALLRAFVAPYVALGCVADIAIHEDGTDHNPHVHILLTTRALTPDGFGAKLAALEQRRFVKQARERWAELTNHYLKQAGSTLRVDHRSYKARGITAEPTVHRGPDRLERQQKREHARRTRAQTRKEQTMAKPTAHERRDYPHLTARATWPPEPVAAPELSPQERDEHRRYWEEQKIQQLETEYRTEPDPQPAPEPAQASRPARPGDQPWYEQALANAARDQALTSQPVRQAQDDWRTQQQRNPFELQEREQARYDADILARAKAMVRTRAEHEALAAVRDAPPESRRFVENFILQERMRTLRERDRAEDLRRVSHEQRRLLEGLRRDAADWEHDLPVPGPNNEPISPRQRDLAQERLLEEHLREEEDRNDRDR